MRRSEELARSSAVIWSEIFPLGNIEGFRLRCVYGQIGSSRHGGLDPGGALKTRLFYTVHCDVSPFRLVPLSPCRVTPVVSTPLCVVLMVAYCFFGQDRRRL